MQQRGPRHEGVRDATWRVGVVADPGLPSKVAADVVNRGLTDLLAFRVSPDVRWEVQLLHETLPLNEQRTVPLLESAARRRPDNGWDVLVYLTDLPRRLDSQPVIADVSVGHRAVLISLPAIGPFRLRHHVTETLVRLVRRIHQQPPSPEGVARGPVGRLLRRPGEWVSPVREIPTVDEGIDASLALVGLRGRLRLLLGMVRANRPWLLVPHLASATAAAAATAAFGLFYSSIWNMADALAPARLVLIMFLAIAVMVGWLLLYNHLWDARTGQASRRQVVLYNAATLCTVFIGVLCMYALLYALALVAALVVIDAGYLSSQLGHPVGYGAYAGLAWLSSSMGIVAGALGSSLDTEEAVRQATYSRRERDRQARDRATAASPSGTTEDA
ncbi:hypothetical protein ACF09J_19485 [Streptomyces sp. NPDC014889]|uniref:hypothetical protein n=1 Tax=Streptomyces sp. NPDC014889 TaxID=3364928 RepID=UPI0036FEF8FA